MSVGLAIPPCYSTSGNKPAGKHERGPFMAQKNIVVADSGIKFALNPRTKDAGTRLTLDSKTSNKVRSIVNAYVEADDRDLPYADRLKANKRVGMKGNNKLVKLIRDAIKPATTPEPAKVAAIPTGTKARMEERANRMQALKDAGFSQDEARTMLASLYA